MIKYDDLVNKHVMLEKELVTLKKTSEGRRRADKESIASLKKKREGSQQNETGRWKRESKLTNLIIEEKKSLKAQYKARDDDEREARREVESNMREY